MAAQTQQVALLQEHFMVESEPRASGGDAGLGELPWTPQQASAPKAHSSSSTR
jgi:hypothetical protein